MKRSRPLRAPLPPISRLDLDHILEKTAPLWAEMRGRRLFLTGGTGFFGCWILESFLAANREFDLQAQAVVLTRSPTKFRERCPHVAASEAIELVEGDVRDFSFPAGDFPFLIHAATDSVQKSLDRQPRADAAEKMLSTIIDGTKRCLEFAEMHRTEKFLLTSSGAVYGPQPSAITHIEEDYCGAPSLQHPNAAYAEGKRVAELLCNLTAKRTGMECKITRCFAFVGPHLPLDAHFAIGNFVRDAMRGGPIVIQGDGTPARSYLYAADLAIWLWTMLFRAPSPQPFNVGSGSSYSIREIAEEVVAVIQPGIEINVAQAVVPGAPIHRYVPSIQRAESQLGLREYIPLREAIRRTAAWYGEK